MNANEKIEQKKKKKKKNKKTYQGIRYKLYETGRFDGYIGVAKVIGLERNQSNVVIKDVETPKGKYKVTSIGEGAFQDKVILATITLPSSVTEIKDKAFKGCKNLKIATLPDKLESIGSKAFRGCNLTNIIIPDTVDSIANNAFDKDVVLFGNTIYLEEYSITNKIRNERIDKDLQDKVEIRNLLRL